MKLLFTYISLSIVTLRLEFYFMSTESIGTIEFGITVYEPLCSLVECSLAVSCEHVQSSDFITHNLNEYYSSRVFFCIRLCLQLKARKLTSLKL